MRNKMKIKNHYFSIFFAVMVFALGMFGCTTSRGKMLNETRNFKLPYTIAATQKQALVYIVRPSNAAIIIPFPVFINNPQDENKLMGSTRGMQYMYFYLKPGEYTIYSQAENIAEIKIQATAGKIIFIEQVLTFGILFTRNRLEIIDNLQGTYYVKSCKQGEVLKTIFP